MVILNRLCRVLEADNFSGIPRDGKQNRYESRDWDGTAGVGGTGNRIMIPKCIPKYTFYIHCPPKVWKRPRKVGFWTISHFQA